MKKQIAQPGQRVIFLNVDGVLTNANRYWLDSLSDTAGTGSYADILDPTALRLMEKFCQKFNAVIVMASALSQVFRTVDAWKGLFAEAGVDLPVVDALPLGSCWLLEARAYMADMPDVQWVLFEDDACPPPNAQDIVSVKKAIGLTTADLQLAAQFMAPDSKELQSLKELNRSFGVSRY